MKKIRATLETKLGKVSNDELNFAIQQFERNMAQIGQTKAKMTDARMYDELSTSIDFYRRRIK